MKRFFILIAISMLLATMAYGGFEQGVKKVTLKVEGMVTPCCIPHVEEALLKVKGVKKASACIKRGIVEVEMEAAQVTTAQLIKAVEKAGFKASVEAKKESKAVPQLESKFKELGMIYNLV